MQNTENRTVAPDAIPGAHSSDKRRLSEAFNRRLAQWSNDPAAIPPDMTRSAFELPQATREPQSLGIPWLDTMLGGGLADGEVFLFLAPSAGGKTTLATQIAWSRAMQRSHAMYFTYDQAIEGDIANRFYSLTTEVPRRELEKDGIAGMSPEIQRRFQVWREAYGRFLHLYDASGGRQGRGSLEDITDAVRHETDQGRRPSLVIIDWIQCAVLKGMKLDGVPATELAGRMDDYARQFAAVCRKQRIQGIMMQQLAGSYQRAWDVELDHTMAEACNTLGDHCQHAVVIGRLTPEGYGTMISSKGVTPASDRPPQRVRLDGAMNKIEVVDDLRHDEEIEKLTAMCKADSRANTKQSAADHSDRRII